jgi:hypothetical protein
LEKSIEKRMRNIYQHQQQANSFNSLSNNASNHYQQQESSNQFINNFTNKSYQHNLSLNNASNSDAFNQSNDHQKQYQMQSPKQLIKQFNQMTNVTNNSNNKFKPLAQMSHLNSPTASPTLSASSHQNLNYYANGSSTKQKL